jgi:RNA polymerase sigma-32 factor
MTTALATKSAANLDGLDTYMREVRRIPLLSRDEEQSLAERWAADADVDAAHKLVTSNLRFVVKVAMEYRSYGMRILDLVQEGNVGLMHAVRKFDPARGYRLITYAVWWIRAYIQTYLLRGYSLVKMGTTQAQRRLFFKLSAAQREMERNMWDEALSPEERHAYLADKLGVRAKDVSQMEMRMAARDFSLDLSLDEAGETTHLDMLESEVESSDAIVATRQMSAAIAIDLADAMESLNEREREVIELRYMQDEPPTLKEIGKSWGVSRERARQIEAAAREKLKKHLMANSRVTQEALAA